MGSMSDSAFTTIPDIQCQGTPYEIGLQHGQQAGTRIHGSIAFYTSQFQQSCALDWPAVRTIASRFAPTLDSKWPDYLEEMRGIATGADVLLEDILAINVRTEITFGMFSDGCTSLSWHDPPSNSHLLAQNWDWMEAQKANLVRLSIVQQGKPTIKMVTEAGLIGKIGINECGVGVCFNAIRAKGADFAKLPCHLALRMALESRSRREAVEKLEGVGVAAACHILIADADTGGIGLECSHLGIMKLDMKDGRVGHANHFVLEHEGIEDTKWIKDSTRRTERIWELSDELKRRKGGSVDAQDILEMFKDEDGLPGAICRLQIEEDTATSATLFNVVMDLKKKTASYRIGRPSQVAQQEFVFDFGG